MMTMNIELFLTLEQDSHLILLKLDEQNVHNCLERLDHGRELQHINVCRGHHFQQVVRFSVVESLQSSVLSLTKDQPEKNCIER
jgi:hypothetical protein